MNNPQAAEQPYTGPGYYRVQGDWEGGGFGYTLHFASEGDAWAWGRAKAGVHRGVSLSVALRQPDGAFQRLKDQGENDARQIVAGGFTEEELLQGDRENNAGKAERCARENAGVALALQMQVNQRNENVLFRGDL